MVVEFVASDCSCEFVENAGGDWELSADRVDAEFVVAASQVLHEGVAADRYRGRGGRVAACASVSPVLHSVVVALDPVVRVDARVTVGVGSASWAAPINALALSVGDLLGWSVLITRAAEDSVSRGCIWAGGDEDVDHRSRSVGAPSREVVRRFDVGVDFSVGL